MNNQASYLPNVNYITDCSGYFHITERIVFREENADGFVARNQDEFNDILRTCDAESSAGVFPVLFKLQKEEDFISHRIQINTELIGLPLEGSYILMTGREDIKVYSASEAGLFYGLQTLKQMLGRKPASREIPVCTIVDWPYKEFRALHLYMPGRNQIEYFKRLIKTAAGLRYNKLILEVGAGMEYERHPEINKAWERFVREVLAYPGKEEGLQNSQGYLKDSIHIALGNGSFLTKEEVRDIIAYANRYYLEVIPEVQSLSHSYYLLLAHKELAERTWDPWPDTFCPSNPKSYELLFDVMEEVIEVFRPKSIHIGHDEVHTLKLCDQCRDKDAAQLFTGDVVKAYEYLKKRGISISMWSDMLTEVETSWGFTGGGAKTNYDPVHQEEYYFYDTTEAIELLPRDILMYNWMWWVSHDVQKKIADKGYSMILGNFSGVDFKNWEIWGANKYIKGAVIGTWCDNSFEVQAHDGILFNLVYSGSCLWDCHFTEASKNKYRIKTAKELPAIYNYLSGKELFPEAFDEKPYKEIDLSQINGSSCRKNSMLHLKPDTGKLTVDISASLGTLRFYYYWEGKHPFSPSWGGCTGEDEIVAFCTLNFDDYSSVRLPVKYGIHISNCRDDWGTATGSYFPFGPETVCYLAEPVFYQEDNGLKQLYCCNFHNPYPSRPLRSIEFELTEDRGEIVIRKMEYR